jgi:hypothetical protein
MVSLPYHIKDPDQFKLKPPRRWDPSGLKKHAPQPFYNREEGHLFAQQHVHNRQSVLVAGASKVSMAIIFVKNIKERLEFVEMYKYWIVCNWKRAVFSDVTRLIIYALTRLLGIRFMIKKTIQFMLSNKQ